MESEKYGEIDVPTLDAGAEIVEFLGRGVIGDVPAVAAGDLEAFPELGADAALDAHRAPRRRSLIHL